MNTPESKVAAVISYLTWIGWIAAVIMRSDREEYKGCEFTRRHINQAFFINVVGIAGGIIFGLSGVPGHLMIGGAVSTIEFALWIIGLYRAATGVWKPLPIVGDLELIK